MSANSEIPNIAAAPVESWEIDKILPYPENHKVHPPKQVEALAKSIKNQGLNDPITVDGDGYIISGHGRFEAIKKLGWKACPVRHLKMLSKEQADKLRIAANKTSSDEYDYEALQRELNRLGGLGVDLDDIGLDDKELEMMVGEIGDLDMDTIAEDIGEAVSDFEKESADEAEELEGEEITLSKAFGVKKVPLGFRKSAVAFMADIEAKTGLEGAEALTRFVQDYING
ncbi:MAG: ParB/Srx family N-terminal domain-containing protein [Hyphomonas sp.]|nr:ParB/Srx family N-terminal domain-containing protein [Hyphomonas sp.]